MLTTLEDTIKPKITCSYRVELMEQIKSIYSILFYWIKIQTKTEDVHVINFVDLVTRIPKHLDLHFSDFLRISRHFQSSQQEIKKT